MEDFEYLTKPFFWLFAALQGVLLSIIANLITPKVRHFFEARSTKKKQKEIEAQRAHLSSVLALEEDVVNRIELKTDGVYLVLRGVLLCAFGLLSVQILNFLAPISWSAFRFSAFFIAAACIVRSGNWIDEARTKFGLARLHKERLLKMQELDPESFDDWEREEFGLTAADVIGEAILSDQFEERGTSN